MFSAALEHVQQRVNATDIEADPFPHIEIENIFSEELYQAMLANRIADDCLFTLSELKRVDQHYPTSRQILELRNNLPILSSPTREFWQSTYVWLTGPFKEIMLTKFQPQILARFGEMPNLHAETLYTRDRTDYALGPHTDAPHKVLTFLIYLPKDNSDSNIGTSIYRPRNPDFTCQGGPRYDFDSFDRVKTAPYQPNTLFGFVKTSRSFHGVEPITGQVTRDLLIYDIHLAK
jgi:hypothetical protein